ncbi:MAG: transketolase family protein [Candidatus Aenigmatarchaeota archaeon]
MKSTRDAFGEALAEFGSDERIVVLDADLSKSTKTCMFAEKFPDRFFNVGVAEQDLFGTAAGFALTGKIPFASTFAIFVCRAWEQIRNAIAYPNLNVRIAATHSGISCGEDGVSHHATEDIALMRAIPNMAVIVPADAIETKKAIKATLDWRGPVYIRMNRPKSPLIFNDDYDYEIGNASVIKDGSDVSIIACGIMVSEAVKASEILNKNGISAEVVNMHTIKPLDAETILKTGKKTGRIVTCEDHGIIGGLGSAVAEVIAGSNIKLERIGVKGFCESGSHEELFMKYGLNAESIANAIKNQVIK